MVSANPTDKSVDLNDLVGLREHGHVLRGAYLDAFARLESAIMDRLVGAKPKVSPVAPLRQKIDRLASTRDNFSNPAKLDGQIEVMKDLNDARSDIVHSVLTVVVRYDGNKPMDHWLAFQNACDDSKPLRSVTEDELKKMTRKAMQIASWLRKQQATAPTEPSFST